MVKWLLLPVLVLGGCALIDAGSEPSDDDEFELVQCGWQPCDCGYTGCDPRFDCLTVACNTCRDEFDCAFGDTCEAGICASCNLAEFLEPVTIQKQEEKFTCEGDPINVGNPVCLRDSCFQQ